MACLPDTVLVQLVDGSLQLEAAGDLEAHIDRCERCFRFVASLLRQDSSVIAADRSARTEPPPPEKTVEPFDAGRRYRVRELIGRGGMGQVYRALDRLTGRHVALKRVLREGHARPLDRTDELDDPGAAAYTRCLEQEFRILATLRHPNIISVLDYGFYDPLQPFFTMELLEGAQPILPFARTLPQQARIELLIQFLRALGYLHRRGVLHRDLKPSEGASDRESPGIVPNGPRRACGPTRVDAEDRTRRGCRPQTGLRGPDPGCDTLTRAGPAPTESSVR